MLAVVVASGPSLTKADCDLARWHAPLAITVNSSWQMMPNANYHYSNDHDWWATYRGEVEGKARGVCITGHSEPRDMVRIPFDRSAPGFVFNRRCIGWGGNSGFAAINLAWWFGATKILLLGFDCKWQGSKPRWHGAHPAHLQNQKPGFHRWIAYHERGAVQMKERGIEIINCSPDTDIHCYPRMSVEKACYRL